jgi:hypothetical protein
VYFQGEIEWDTAEGGITKFETRLCERQRGVGCKRMTEFLHEPPGGYGRLNACRAEGKREHDSSFLDFCKKMDSLSSVFKFCVIYSGGLF